MLFFCRKFCFLATQHSIKRVMNGHEEELFDELLNLEEQYQREGRTAGILYDDANWGSKKQGRDAQHLCLSHTGKEKYKV